MNSSLKRSRSRLKPLAVAVALAALPSVALAVSTDVVTTRADQNIDQQYGRDSVYGFSPESKPLSPERTSGPQSLKWFHKGDADANVSALYTGYVRQQQEGMDAGSGYTDAGSDYMNAGSGYTGTETTSQVDTGPVTLAQFSSDNALVGEAQGQWESGSVLVLPLAMEGVQEPVALDDPVALNDDGTATQFDRGYYKDPDQSDIIIILPDIVAMAGDQSASSEEGTPANTD